MVAYRGAGAEDKDRGTSGLTDEDHILDLVNMSTLATFTHTCTQILMSLPQLQSDQGRTGSHDSTPIILLHT